MARMMFARTALDAVTLVSTVDKARQMIVTAAPAIGAILVVGSVGTLMALGGTPKALQSQFDHAHRPATPATAPTAPQNNNG